MGYTIQEVQTEGFSVKYARFGAGPRPLVILPGLSVQSVMGAAGAVEKEYEALKEDFTLYLIDRREPAPPVYPVEQMAENTAAVLAALGLGRVCLFGASQGGMMALCLAAAHPELVDRLAVASTAARVDRARYACVGSWVRLARAADPVGLYLAFGEAVYPPALFESYRPALIMAGRRVTEAELQRFTVLAEGMEHFDLTSRLGQIRCPTLVLGSADDRVLGPEAAGEIIAGLTGVPELQTHLYDGYGHAAYDTAPDCRDRLLRFFMG